MHPEMPPPLPQRLQPAASGPPKLIILLALIPALIIASLILLRVCGLIRPFSIPTNPMAPAIAAGDHIIMEGFTFIFRDPCRGDIVVFKTDGIPSIPPGALYMKRVVGLPGEHIRISAGKLFVNEQSVSLSNALGQIIYPAPSFLAGSTLLTNIDVPRGCYYVLGDYSRNSLDSRNYGCVPRKNIIGRAAFCYWPPGRVGAVK